MLRIGVLGFSEGNGHPFSFSAILNGFSAGAMREAGWPGIADYLRQRDGSEIGGLGARVTHVWAPERAVAQAVATAAFVETVVDDPEEMIGNVDAVMVLRDDAGSHPALAWPFLDAGLPVFVDKPLTLQELELRRFEGALGAGRLFSVSGLRFARELDGARVAVRDGDRPGLIRAAVLNDWPRYGVHMIDAVFGVTPARPTAVTSLRSASVEAFAIEMDDGSLVEVACLGSAAKTFRVDLLGAGGCSSFDLYDNFSAFRRTIVRFLGMVRSGEPPIPPADTLASIRTLIAGVRSRAEGRRVPLAEVEG